MDDILKVIRTERHDFLNHLQVISGLVQLKKEDKVLEYINKVTKEIYSLGKLTRINDSWIATTLLLKNYEALQKEISFELEIDTEMEELNYSCQGFSEKLKKLLGVIFESCQSMKAQEENCGVKFKATEDDTQYIIEISYPRNDSKEVIFEAIEDIKKLPDINARFFDTDKRFRVYISLPKKSNTI